MELRDTGGVYIPLQGVGMPCWPYGGAEMKTSQDYRISKEMYIMTDSGKASLTLVMMLTSDSLFPPSSFLPPAVVLVQLRLDLAQYLGLSLIRIIVHTSKQASFCAMEYQMTRTLSLGKVLEAAEKVPDCQDAVKLLRDSTSECQQPWTGRVLMHKVWITSSSWTMSLPRLCFELPSTHVKLHMWAQCLAKVTLPFIAYYYNSCCFLTLLFPCPLQRLSRIRLNDREHSHSRVLRKKNSIERAMTRSEYCYPFRPLRIAIVTRLVTVRLHL